MEQKTHKRGFVVVLIVALFLFTTGFSAVTYFNPENEATIPQKLSLTGIYTGKVITAEATQYQVNVPQWTDSIPSLRYILVQAPGKITFSDTADYFGYPDNVIFVRTLYIDVINGNPASRKFFETRLLVKGIGKNEWFNFNYVWNNEQTDADFVSVEPIGVNYTITYPTGPRVGRWAHDDITGCGQCHSGRGVNGFLTAQLNRPSLLNPADNQIKYLFEKGIFAGVPPPNFAALPKWVPPADLTASIDIRMHSYVAAQCSQCHGTHGEVEGQELNFDYHAMIDYSYVNTPPPVGVTPLVGLDSTISRYTTIQIPDCWEAKMIYKGDPEASTLYYRMTQRNENPTDFFPDGNQMPPATSFLTDTDALAITYEWICKMDPVMCALQADQKKAGSDHEKCPDFVTDYPSPGTPIGIKAIKKFTLSVPAINNRILQVPEKYSAGGQLEVFMTGINGREQSLNRISKSLFRIDASVPAGVYIFKINNHSFKQVVF